MAKVFQKIKNIFLNIIFPIRCLGCKKYDVWLCEECLNKIQIVDVFMCPNCKEKSLRGETHNRCQRASFLNGLIVAADLHDELVRKLVYVFKYNFVRDLKHNLSQIIIKKIYRINYLFNNNITKYFDYIIPVPLHKTRQLWRGFNQSELLAQEISKETNIPVLDNVVFRVKNTKSQVKKGKEKKRQINIQGAFKINNPVFNGAVNLVNKKILLVDDVFTTGSTMQEVAKVLKQANAGEIWGLVVAKG